MSFYANGGTSGIRLGGHDLSEFSCQLLTGFTLGAPSVQSDTFQGDSRSSLLCLGQSFGPMELVLPLEIWGSSRQDTVEKWSRLCYALQGSVDLELGDGFVYGCVLKELGTPAWISEGWLATEVTLWGLRQKPEVTKTLETKVGAKISCESTFPRTDCTIRLPQALLKGAEQLRFQLGDNTWFLNMAFTGREDLVLDGVKKRFLLGTKNVAAEMLWEDFPYLVPGDNKVALFLDTIGVTRELEVTYRPTFL